MHIMHISDIICFSQLYQRLIMILITSYKNIEIVANCIMLFPEYLLMKSLLVLLHTWQYFSSYKLQEYFLITLSTVLTGIVFLMRTFITEYRVWKNNSVGKMIFPTVSTGKNDLESQILKTVSITYDYRAWTSAALRRRAINQVETTRKKEVNKESLILVPHVEGIFSSQKGKGLISKWSVSDKISGSKWKPFGNNSDFTSIKNFLDRKVGQDSPEAVFIDPNLSEMDKLFAVQAPLIEFLSLDSEREDCWDYPSGKTIKKWRDNRGLSVAWKDSVEVREFIIGVDGDEELRNLRQWTDMKINEDNEKLPTGVMSFDVESLQITHFDYLRICDESYMGIDLPLSKDPIESDESGDPVVKGETDKRVNLPVKVMAGGLDWCLIISFHIVKEGDQYIISCRGIPNGVLELLARLPIVTGCGIRADLMEIERVFTEISGYTLRMKGFIELETLAVLAGWQLKSRNMTTMAIVALGSSMNKVCSQADGRWGVSYGMLPEAFQVYALGDIKFGFLAYNVLISLLLRQMFPDPDICCRMSRCTQDVWVAWFCHFIRDALVGTCIYNPDIEAAVVSGSRRDLMLSIKYRDYAGVVSKSAPRRIVFLADLIEWPTLTQGGPRYLHSVRLQYISQFFLLKSSTAIPGVGNYFIKDITALDRLYATYGHLDIRQCDGKQPVLEQKDPFHWLNLEPLPGLTSPLLGFKDMKFDLLNLHQAAIGTNRGLRETLLEYFRLDIDRLLDYFEACISDETMSKSYRGKYEEFRLLYVYVANREPCEVPAAEDTIAAEIEAALSKERKYLAELSSEVRMQEDLCAELSLAHSGSIAVNRFDWKMLPRPTMMYPTAPTRRCPYGGGGARTAGGGGGQPPQPPQGPQGGQKRFRSHSSSQVDQNPSAKKVGRALVNRISDFTQSEVLSVEPLVSFMEPDESTDGGRASKKSSKKSKSKGSTRRVMTQDEIEEERAPIGGIFEDFAPSPEILFELDD